MNIGKRGFAAMDPQEQRKIAKQGGRAAHASGNAHQFSSEEARAAGRKGHESRMRQKAEREQAEIDRVNARARELVGLGPGQQARYDDIVKKQVEPGRIERHLEDIKKNGLDGV